METVYNVIAQLNKERKEVHNQLTEMEHSIKIDKKKQATVSRQYAALDKQIKAIEKLYKIGIHEMTEILNEHTGKKYKLKVFQEMRFYNGRSEYTRHFVACYLYRNHPYYNKNNMPIIHLFPHGYNDFLRSLTPSNSIIFSSNDTITIEPIDPYTCLENINYTYLHTRGFIDEGLIRPEFAEMVAPLIRDKLENTIAMTEEEQLSQRI